MKVTVCFNDVKVIVPCGNFSADNLIAKSSNAFMRPLNLKMVDATASENESSASLHSTSSASSSSKCSSSNSISKLKELEQENYNVQIRNQQVRVSDVIENSILKYKKATGKVRIRYLNTIKLFL
jgi:hypothetical protein